MRRLALFAALSSITLAFAFTPSGCADEIPAANGGGGGSGGSGGAYEGPLLDGDCDPIVPSYCGLPLPSNVWTRSDPTSPTGMRVQFGKTTLPYRPNVGFVNPTTWSDSDGFSAGMTLLVELPGATVTGLPTQHTLDLSITKDSPTLLMEAETGALIPHFAEIDASDAAGDGDRMFMIRPVVRLKDATRYIVAIRKVVDKDGVELTPSPAFAALRDGTASDEVSVGRRRGLYQDIFGRLEKAGVPRDDLQLAWDYTTASRENNTRALVHMRDDALAAVGDEGPTYVIDSIEDDPNPRIKRRILGRMTVPLYLDKPGPGGKLVLGEDGLPKQNGTAEYEFLVHVPHAATMGEGKPLLQNGHGLLGRKTEGQNGYLAQIADTYGYVAFGVDLVGMAEEDFDSIFNVITGDIGGFRQLVDRQHQGIVNSLLAMRMMKGRFYKDPAVQFNGVSAIDPSHCFYRGDSQGGIFGTTYMAISTDVTRGMLGEPGMPYNLLLNRSVDFDPFFGALQLTYGTGRAIQVGLGLVQMLWDRTEPSGYAPYITQDTLPGTPAHELLIHVALGDYQVTPLGAHLIARAIGAKNLSPVNRSIYGVPEAGAPFSGSGIVEFDFGLPPAPDTNTPPQGPEDDDPHDKVRVLTASQAQTDVFFKTGVIQAFCSGACDPE